MGMEAGGFDAVPEPVVPDELENTEGENFVESLKGHSMNVDNLYLAGYGKNTNELMADMPPLSWNENGGVLVYSDKDGKKYAVPATDSIRDSFSKQGIVRNESIGVPALSGDVWGTEEQRNSSSARAEWLNLLDSSK